MPFVPLPGDYRQLLASKQGLEAMLTTAAAAMAGTAPGQLRHPVPHLVIFMPHGIRLWTFDGKKVSFFYRHLGCWTRGVMLQAQAQALEPPA